MRQNHNAVMPLSRASTRGRYSCIVGVTVDSQLTEAFPGVTGASPPITPGKQRLGVYLRGVLGLELLAPNLEVGRD